jgi:nucleotide-binding universal stress UspA family protein
MKRIQRIVVGTDFSEIADAALDAAVDLAQQVGAAVTLVHAYEIPVYGVPDGALVATADLAGKLANAAQEGLLAASERYRSKGITIDTVVRVGLPWNEVNAVAADVHADLIVVGTHGRRGFAHAFLGSVAERLIRTASRPVLVVRGKGSPS